MFLSQQGLFCASLLAVLPLSSQGLGEGELVLLVGDSLKFSPGVCLPVGLSCFCLLSCVDSTYPVSIITCPGKRWPFSSQGMCFLFGTYPPAHALSARHQQTKG